MIRLLQMLDSVPWRYSHRANVLMFESENNIYLFQINSPNAIRFSLKIANLNLRVSQHPLIKNLIFWDMFFLSLSWLHLPFKQCNPSPAWESWDNALIPVEEFEHKIWWLRWTRQESQAYTELTQIKGTHCRTRNLIIGWNIYVLHGKI